MKKQFIVLELSEDGHYVRLFMRDKKDLSPPPSPEELEEIKLQDRIILLDDNPAPKNDEERIAKKWVDAMQKFAPPGMMEFTSSPKAKVFFPRMTLAGQVFFLTQKEYFDVGKPRLYDTLTFDIHIKRKNNEK